MTSSNLITMANRIGEFFEAMPDRDEALEGVAQHIQKFWEPRMRRQLRAGLLNDTTRQQLKPIVCEALERHPDTSQTL